MDKNCSGELAQFFGRGEDGIQSAAPGFADQFVHDGIINAMLFECQPLGIGPGHSCLLVEFNCPC